MNGEGKTPVELAEESGNQGIITALENHISQHKLPSQQSSVNLHHNAQLVAPISMVIDTPQVLPFSEPSSSKRRSELSGDEQHAVDCKRWTIDFPKETEIFPASGVKSSLHGVAYQWKLLMLFAMRSLQQGYTFRLATEMDAVEKFDDVVFQYVKGGSDVKSFRFLQAKHIEVESETSRKINAQDLLTEKDGKFSLPKYFRSYQKIKKKPLFQQGELQDFIICTNISFGFDDNFNQQGLKKLSHEQPLYLKPVTEADDVLNAEGERYRLVSTTHPEGQAVVSALKSLFEEMSEFKKLATALAERLLYSKTIGLNERLFKDYQKPLARCVFDVRANKMAKMFVEGNLDEKVCPGVNAFRSALREAIEKIEKEIEKKPLEQRNERDKELLKKKNLRSEPPTKKQKMAVQTADTDRDDFWHDIGEGLLRFSDNFKKAVAQEPNPPLTNRTTCFPEDQVTDEEVNDFLNHLIFAVNQPNEKRLSELISEELGNEFNLIDADFITSDFQSRILDWLKEKQGSYQSENTIDNFFCEMREKVSQLVLIGPTSEQTKKLQEYGVKFDDNALPATLKEFLKSSNRKSIFNFITAPEQTLLGSIEINQMLEDIDEYKKQGSFIFISLNSLLLLKKEVLTVFRKEGTSLLIVECKKEPAKEIQTLYKQLSEIIKCNSRKKVILIAPEEHPLAAQFKTEEHKERYQKIVDKIEFRDLTSDSQKKILEKTINFQGCKIALNQLMSADSPITTFLPLADLIEENPLKIGESLPNSNGYDEGYYIGRTFNHQRAIKQGILNDKREQKFSDLLAETEEEFTHLCSENSDKSVHWLSKDASGRLIWQKSQGSLTALYQYIDTRNTYSYPPDNLDNLLEQAQHQRVMLIADKAGMGKTTVLTHLSKQIKQKFQTHWVARIDLNDHTDVLETQAKQEIGAVQFLSQKLLKLVSPLEKSLFKQRLEEGKVVLMLDGFDEISPSYKETVIDLLQSLKNTATEQLWVTTRPHLREALEDKLQQFSYTLEPFSEANQVDFLIKYWKKTLESELKTKSEEERLKTYATELIEKLVQSISDKEKEFTGVPLQTRMLAEGFDKELKIFCDSDKSKPDLPNKINLLKLYKRFLNRKYDIYQEEKAKIPLNNMVAKEQRKRDFEYIREKHQLLALQVLFTEEQVRIFQVNSKSLFSGEELTRIGIVQYIDNKPHFIHRTFAEYFVADFLINQLTKEIQHSSKVQDFLLKDVFLVADYQVIRAFTDDLLEKSKPPAQTLKEYGNRINELWQEGSLKNADKAILHQAAQEDNAHIIDFLLNSLNEEELTDTLNKMLLAGDILRQTALHWAAKKGNVEAIKKLWEWAEKLNLKNDLLLAEDIWRVTAWNMAAEKGNVEVLKKLWDWAEKLNPKNLLLLAKDSEGRTALHWAAVKVNIEALKKLWEWAEELNLKNDLLLDKDSLGRTALHWAAEKGNVKALEKLWECAEEVNLKNYLLPDNDNRGRTAFHLAAEKGNVKALKKLWEWAEELKSKNDLLLDKDSLGLTALHWTAEKGNVEALEKLWEWAEEVKLKNDMLLDKDNWGRTALHYAAEKGNVKALEKLREWAEEVNLKNDLLLHEDNWGRTALHLAAEKGNVEALKNVWEWAEEVNPKNNLLLGKDYRGRTALHLAAEKGNVKALEKLLEWAEEIKHKKNLLLAKDNRERTALHWAAQKVNVEALKKLWESAEEVNLKNYLFLAKDNEGRTVLHWAAEKGNVEALQNLSEWAEELNRKNDLLLANDIRGRTALHWAAENGNVEALEKLWEWAEDVNLKNYLLLVKDNWGRTALHWATEKRNIDAVEKLRFWAEEVNL